MSISKSLGGDRLGSGNKMDVKIHGFERSSHDLGAIWRSTMAPGVLVPFLQQYALNGDTFEINLNTLVRTLPTNAPLYGSFKMQMDIFEVPIRLYIKELKNNLLNVGMKMNTIAIPQIRVYGDIEKNDYKDNPTQAFKEINSSSLLAYLGIRGIGLDKRQSGVVIKDKYFYFREFNMLGILAYWDIFKNYYSNKQEKEAYFIGNESKVIKAYEYYRNYNVLQIYYELGSYKRDDFYKDTIVNIGDETLDLGYADVSIIEKGVGYAIIEINVDAELLPDTEVIINTNLESIYYKLNKFELTEIDDIIDQFAHRGIKNTNAWPSTMVPKLLNNLTSVRVGTSAGATAWDYNKNKYIMNGLLTKTYQSDIFNNYLNEEWIDGQNGVSALTAIDTSSGSFTMDTLNLAGKLYRLLNRLSVSGGTYQDWQEVVWGEKVWAETQTPLYRGGASTEIVFNEVVSMADTDNIGLGALGGKGTTTGNLKGGYIKIKVKEPSIIMGIVSITPRVDYAHGNEWYGNIKNMDMFHKPSLDGIGFQDLITDQMAYWNTELIGSTNEVLFKSIGKQPAWINYMTNFNKVYGEFANEDEKMYMTLVKRYKPYYDEIKGWQTEGFSTYINPEDYNYVFNYANLDSQNFWVQIAMDITARRKMSAKVIPNL